MEYYRTKLFKYFKIIIVRVMNSNNNSNTRARTCWTLKHSRYPTWTHMDTGQGTLLPHQDIKILNKRSRKAKRE